MVWVNTHETLVVLVALRDRCPCPMPASPEVPRFVALARAAWSVKFGGMEWLVLNRWRAQ